MVGHLDENHALNRRLVPQLLRSRLGWGRSIPGPIQSVAAGKFSRPATARVVFP